MATSKVLLVKPVEDLGAEGEQVEVKAGYARNFLYPQNLAIPVTKANKKQIEALVKAREAREARELESASALAKALEEALKVTERLDDKERRARQGLVSRAVTIR